MIPRAARGVPPPGAGDRAPCHISRARGGGVGRFGQIRDQRSESCFCRPRRAAARSRRRGRFSPAEPPGAPAEPELRLTAVPPGGGDARDPESLRPWGTAAGSGVPATAWQWQAVPGTGTATVAGTPLASELSRSQRRVRHRSLPPAVQAPALQAAVTAVTALSAGRGPASSPGTARRTCLGPRLCQSPSRAGFPPQFRCFPPTLPPRSPEAPFGLRSCGLWISDMSEAEMSEEENIPRGGGQASRALAATGTVPATVAGRGLMRFRAHLHHWQRQPHWLGWVS